MFCWIFSVNVDAKDFNTFYCFFTLFVSLSFSKNFLFFSIFYWLFYYSCPTFFFPLFSSILYTLPPSFCYLSSCPWVVHMFVGFSISYSILNLPLSILCLLIMLFIPCIFFPSILPLLVPTDNPRCDLHFCDSVPVLVVCLDFVFLF